MKISAALATSLLALSVASCGEPEVTFGDCDMVAMTEEMTEKMRQMAESGDSEKMAEFQAKQKEISEKTVAGLEDQSYSPEQACSDYEELMQIAS